MDRRHSAFVNQSSFTEAEDISLQNDINVGLTNGLSKIHLSAVKGHPSGSYSAGKSCSLKHASELSASVDSDDQDNDEMNDKVAPYLDDTNNFRQIDYVFLFNDKLKFSERTDFKMEDKNITASEFIRMRNLNRQFLTAFFKKTQFGVAEDTGPDEQMQCDSGDEDEDAWADDNLDESIKAHLSKFENGETTPVDVVSHFEYFYNTLHCSHSTSNPFDDH